jgi:hypothetical protein
MQRFLALIALIVFSIPVGISIAGCGGSNPNNFCTKNGFGYGQTTSQVAAISLGPASTGVSLSYGQIGQVNSPTATNCNGGSVSVSSYTYGSTNLNLADINPSTGQICAGTWNRHSASGIPDFTICTPPTQSGVAQVTASASAVTSNPVYVYIHPSISAITIGSQTSCVSQNQVLTDSNGNQLPLNNETTVYDQEGNVIPQQYVGTVTYTPVNSTIVTINNTSNGTTSSSSTVNGLATALQPGSTVVNATLSSVTSAAGYFFTCPPKSIGLALNGANGYPTPITVSASSPQNLTTTVTDTSNATISGLSLDYTSTQPKQISVSSAGTVTATFPTTTTVSAICQPGTCNPSPINIVGQLGTGMPVTSNTVTVNSPGRSSSKLWLASSQSQYFTPIDLTSTGSPTPIKLPYIPNSMVLDQAGTNLYFGSYHELMVVSASTNSVSKEDLTVPGVVLAVSPDGSTAVINDQVNQIIYLYTESKGTSTSIGGLATRAQFSPDGKNLYIVGPNNLYVHNAQTGWTTYDLAGQPTSCNLNNNNGNATFDPFCTSGEAVTVPSVGVFMGGASFTTARSFCPNGSPTITYNPLAYPAGEGAASGTDQLASANNGSRILGATASTAQITDIQFPSASSNTPPTPPTGSCPVVASAPLQFSTTSYQAPLGITPTEITGVVPSEDSTLAFVTYNATSATGVLPAYKPTQGAAGTVSNVQLSTASSATAPEAPLAGAFSPDNATFFVGTSGDNLLHLVDVTSLTDTQTINPKLPSCVLNPSGGTSACDPTTFVPVQFIAVQPRPTT